MRLIHCTQKLLKELKVTDPVTDPDSPPATGLGNWYANFTIVDHKKFIVFMSERTLYTFLLPLERVDDLHEFRTLFITNLCLHLQHEGYDLRVINKIHQEYRGAGIAIAANKSALGSLTAMTNRIKVHAKREGVLALDDIFRLNQKLFFRPVKSIGFKYPIELVYEIFRRPK